MLTLIPRQYKLHLKIYTNINKWLHRGRDFRREFHEKRDCKRELDRKKITET
jgi:hypothetical protein